MKYDELVLKTAPATGSIWHLLGSFVLQVGSDNNECCQLWSCDIWIWAGSDGVFISFGYFIAYAGVRVGQVF